MTPSATARSGLTLTDSASIVSWDSEFASVGGAPQVFDQGGQILVHRHLLHIVRRIKTAMHL